MVSRIPPSRRDAGPDGAWTAQRAIRAVSQQTPGTGRVAQAAPVLSSEVRALLRGKRTLPPSTSGPRVTVSETAPSSPSVGDFWYNTGAPPTIVETGNTTSLTNAGGNPAVTTITFGSALQAGDLIVVFANHSDGNDLTAAGAGATWVSGVGTNNQQGFAYGYEATAGSTSCTISFGFASWAAVTWAVVRNAKDGNPIATSSYNGGNALTGFNSGQSPASVQVPSPMPLDAGQLMFFATQWTGSASASAAWNDDAGTTGGTWTHPTGAYSGTNGSELAYLRATSAGDVTSGPTRTGIDGRIRTLVFDPQPSLNIYLPGGWTQV